MLWLNNKYFNVFVKSILICCLINSHKESNNEFDIVKKECNKAHVALYIIIFHDMITKIYCC